ncbi:hypothetical protein OIU76_002605, partial [Salix suchowensis]
MSPSSSDDKSSSPSPNPPSTSSPSSSSSSLPSSPSASTGLSWTCASSPFIRGLSVSNNPLGS